MPAADASDSFEGVFVQQVGFERRKVAGAQRASHSHDLADAALELLDGLFTVRAYENVAKRVAYIQGLDCRRDRGRAIQTPR
jgi:hypothetical protein